MGRTVETEPSPGPVVVSTMPLFARYGRPRAGKPATILG